VYNVNGPVFDLATTVGKFLHLGLTLDDALAKVTAVPAGVIGMADRLGTLAVGAWGDAVIFDDDREPVDFVDSRGVVRVGHRCLLPRTVIKSGKIYPAISRES
jgi:dihydroorotase